MSALILALLLGLSTQTSPAEDATTAESEEILVIALKMRKGLVKHTYDANGVAQCRIVKSTKDPEIDAIGCAAMRYCDAQLQPHLQSIFSPAVSKKDRKKRLSDFQRGPHRECYFAKRDEMKGALARKRAQARP